MKKESITETAAALGKFGRQISSQITSHLRLPGLKPRSTREAACEAPPGAMPGIESMANVNEPPPEGVVRIRVADYGPEKVEMRDVSDLAAFLKESRPEGCQVRWLNVDGLHPYVVNQLRTHFGFHTLAAEDVLRIPQRPKIETYEGHLFIVARMMMFAGESLQSEQVSFFLFKDTLITFQETAGDVWDPIRQRLQKAGSRLRTLGTSYLLYALLDAVVDHCFPMLEHYGDRLEALENQVLANPTSKVQRRLHAIKRELALLRRVIWPMREVMNELQREDTEEIAPEVRAYMRDVYDHAVQVMDIIESCREMVGGLNDLYMSAVSNRMNEVMKVLTIMASFFIPITFVAGVYGMNFEFIPELHWKYSYAVFWAICLTITLTLAVYFWRKGWLGGK